MMAYGLINALSEFFDYIRGKPTTQKKHNPYSHIPQFSDFKKLKDHLSNCPDSSADVIVEGKVEEHGYSKFSLASKNPTKIHDKKGAARLEVTTEVINLEEKDKLTKGGITSRKMTETAYCESVPFKLVDTHGNHIYTHSSIHEAEGFKLLMKEVPFTTGKREPRMNIQSKDVQGFITLNKETTTAHYLLAFGTPIGAYGRAKLVGSSGVSFSPLRVDNSAKSLTTSQNNIPDSCCTFWNRKTLLIVLLGSTLIIAGLYFAFQYYRRRHKKQTNNSIVNHM